MRAILYSNIPPLAPGKCTTLRWRHNERDSVSNHQPHGCLLNGLLRRRSQKTSKLRVTGLCVGNSPGPVQRASYGTKGQLRGKCFHLMTSSWLHQVALKWAIFTQIYWYFSLKKLVIYCHRRVNGHNETKRRHWILKWPTYTRRKVASLNANCKMDPSPDSQK